MPVIGGDGYGGVLLIMIVNHESSRQDFISAQCHNVMMMS